MRTEISAAIISEDFVSSAVLSRTIKEWWCASASCETFRSVDAALRASFLQEADVVFIAEIKDELKMFEAIRSIHAYGNGPLCVVVVNSSDSAARARATALRAGADDCISRYMASEDEVHRCLWAVLRARAAAQLQSLALIQSTAN